MAERSIEKEKERIEKIEALRRNIEKNAFSRIKEEKSKINKEKKDNEKWIKQHEDFMREKRLSMINGEPKPFERKKETRTSSEIRLQKELSHCSFYPKTNFSPQNNRKSMSGSIDSKGGMTLITMAERSKKWYQDSQKKLSNSRSKEYLSPRKSTSPMINDRSKRLVKS